MSHADLQHLLLFTSILISVTRYVLLFDKYTLIGKIAG